MFSLRLLVLITLTAFLFPTASYGGKKKLKEGDENYEYHFSDAALDSEQLSIQLSKAHAQRDFVLTSARIENKTSDYLFVNKEQFLFRFDFGDWKVKDGKVAKSTVIAPGGKKKMPLKVTGSENFDSVRAFAVQFDGFRRAPSTGDTVEAPDFQLPASINSVSAGPFSCALKGKVTQETDLTKVKFSCSYNGEHVGFIDPTRVALRIPSGQEFANTNNAAKRKMLQPGDKVVVVVSYVVERRVVDMQFATMFLDFRDAFAEAQVVPMEVGSIDLAYDLAKTVDQNN